MSGFDITGLLPFYLDETDEQISGLNEMLLKLEEHPGDEKALREAFRLVHSIKGSSTVMGYVQVKGLTHNLETFFDEIRAGKRDLDRAFLNLCFRCLDALRDYHTDLRAKGQSEVDLSGLTTLVIDQLKLPHSTTPQEIPAEPVTTPSAEAEPPPPEVVSPPSPAELAPEPVAVENLSAQPGVVTVTVRFEPNIQWPDMKARLVLNRLATKGRVLATEPRMERLDEVEALTKFTVWLSSEGAVDEFHALADVDGVTAIEVVTPPGPLPIATVPLPFAPTPSTLVIQSPVVFVPPPISPNETSPAATVSASRATMTGEAKKSRVAETVRVDADRLDHLMNLAGELVINKARFAEIARGLEDLFRGSNAELLAADTMERLDTISRGLEGKEGSDDLTLGDGSSTRWGVQFRRLRENIRAILDDLDQVRQGRERLNTMADAIHHLGRVSDGIQKGVLETRMVPIGPLFDRFQRVVRDLRQSSNKEVVLKIEGEKTELDKRMIDELADPLVHMVRNSVDHGLESPSVREAAGKPRAGTVLLSASHRGNSVVITVSDDGRGIDCGKVRKKAVAKGLISEEEARRLTDRQIIPFIFHPGLSTAEAVTDISGRGVGMDIVKSRIEELNGTLDVRSEPGLGTNFMIRLPLTLAIMPVLLVRFGGEAYAIPLDHLDEIVEVRADQVFRVQGRRSIEVRGKIIALVGLEELFRQDPGAETTASSKHTVVVVSNGEATVGLIVGQLLGMQEAVLKSLEKNFRPVLGLSGASILGDGRVSLILDIDALIEMATLESVHSLR